MRDKLFNIPCEGWLQTNKKLKEYPKFLTWLGRVSEHLNKGSLPDDVINLENKGAGYAWRIEGDYISVWSVQGYSNKPLLNENAFNKRYTDGLNKTLKQAAERARDFHQYSYNVTVDSANTNSIGNNNINSQEVLKSKYTLLFVPDRADQKPIIINK